MGRRTGALTMSTRRPHRTRGSRPGRKQSPRLEASRASLLCLRKRRHRPHRGIGRFVARGVVSLRLVGRHARGRVRRFGAIFERSEVGLHAIRLCRPRPCMRSRFLRATSPRGKGSHPHSAAQDVRMVAFRAVKIQPVGVRRDGRAPLATPRGPRGPPGPWGDPLLASSGSDR